MSENTAPPTTVTLDVVAFDCPDANELAAFYRGLLGWEVRDGSDDEWVTIAPGGAGAGSQALAFQRVDDYLAPTWPGGSHPQQAHLDLEVDDLSAGEQLVLAAGATRHDHQPSETGSFVVYLDPAGHPFCLVS